MGAITPEQGNTALHMVASLVPETTDTSTVLSMREIGQQLLSHGLNPNIQNKQGL